MFVQNRFIAALASLSTALAGSATCKSPSWPPHHHICPGPPGVYVVKPSHEKGLGVFAAHDLDIGDIVMREPPIIRIQPPKVVKGNPYPMSVVSRLVREKFEALPPNAQEEILSLTFHASALEKDSMDELGIIFRTNAYNTGKEVGLFPKIARINHSCRPNTSYYWSERLNKRIVYVTRKIKKGEEFFVSYISLLQNHEERQKNLDQYGFTCQCEACAQVRGAMEVSDSRRITIKKAFTAFEPQLGLISPNSKTTRQQDRKNAKASLQLVELVQEEGLADYYAKAYRIVAITHARVEDWATAAIWANKGYELKFIEDSQSPYTLEMHHLTSSFVSKWESELRNQSRERGES